MHDDNLRQSGVSFWTPQPARPEGLSRVEHVRPKATMNSDCSIFGWLGGGARVCLFQMFNQWYEDHLSSCVFLRSKKRLTVGKQLHCTVSSVLVKVYPMTEKRHIRQARMWGLQHFCRKTKQIMLNYRSLFIYDLSNHEHIILLTPGSKYFEAGCTICLFVIVVFVFVPSILRIKLMKTSLLASRRWRVSWSIRCVA